MSLQRAKGGNFSKSLHILTTQLSDLSIRFDAGWSDGFREYRMPTFDFAKFSIT
jgi:hypothetical protein